MHFFRKALSSFTAAFLLASGVAAQERLQVGLVGHDEPLVGADTEPHILSVRWDHGDLEVLLSQAAPCGKWIPVNPNWEVNDTDVVLHFGWHPMTRVRPVTPRTCLKRVRAWIFRVPEGQYTVAVGTDVPRFAPNATPVSQSK